MPETTDQVQEFTKEELPLTHFVAGIGASAGGLEALEQLFSHVDPEKSISYIVVQHLSPDFESLMDQLLGRITAMPIVQIEDGVEVEPGTIYLLPPKKEVILSDGHLLLTERSSHRELSFPIDSFFRSLAQDAGQRAVAIILSGTGSDGSRGICDVHDAGGFVAVQSEESAKFDGMPRNACDTGIVDAVLAAEEIPDAIVRYTESSVVASRLGNDESSSGGPTLAILSMLKKRYEIDFSHYKTTTITRRIERRIMLSESGDIQAYAQRLRTDPAEIDALYKDLLVGVTSFFRDRDVFNRLEKDVLPGLMERLEPTQEFRAWVVGTASGEEAYTLAILLAETSKALERPPRVKIFASDVHQQSLEFASRGVYQESSLVGISDDIRERYFHERSDGFHVSPDLRKMVVFVPHNVITNAPFTNLDMVSCRNVFIYFTPATQKKVLSLFHFGLKTGGVLCQGSSETPGELSHEFEPIDERNRIYRKQRDVNLPASMRMPFSSFGGGTPLLTTVQPVLPGKSAEARNSNLNDAYDTLLKRFMPEGFLLSEERDLLHTFGNASEYLRVPQGRLSRDILELVDPNLRTALSAALRRLSPEQSATTTASFSDTRSNSDRHVKITADHLAQDDSRILITFEETKAAPKEKRKNVEVASNEILSEDYLALERQLAQTKDSLQSTVEEAHATNEELQAANEQLTASNEELQSTNEELHSVNEELYTVNAEHQRKIEELIQLTDDMDNLLNSTNIHTIFLDKHLKVRRFTPGIGDTFNLLPQDIGRRLDTFTHNIEIKQLTEKVEAVVETERSFEHEVRDKHGTWFLLRILPYLTRGQVDGAVLTLVDITSLKLAESKLAELSEIVEHSDDAIFRQDVDGTIRTWNRGAERLFGRSATEVLGKHVSLLNLDCGDMRLGKILQLVDQGRSLEQIDATQMREGGLHRELSLSVSPIRDPRGVVIGASTIARDVTKQKKAEADVREAIKRRDEFLAMLSHELRNPLAAVLNATNLLSEDSVDTDATEEARDVIEHNVRHVARILDDLLDVSRITNDKINLHKEVVDLNSITIDVVDCVQHRMDAKRQDLHVDKPDEALLVEGDVGRLQQMQVNLLVNASKYTPENGRIDYRVRRDGDDALIEIEDDGEGIPEELLERIFAPFVQAEQTIDRAQGGMGLGLTLVTKVAEAHGGSVSVKSDGVGKGSLFKVRLPLTKKHPSRRVDMELSSIEGKRLLVVEDNTGVRKMLTRTMELKGFEVTSVGSGRDALDVLDDCKPAIAIVDIGLPDVNGYEVAKQIRRRDGHESLLLVALTGYGRERDRTQAMEAGFDIHLVKPLDPNELLRAVAEKYHGTPVS